MAIPRRRLGRTGVDVTILGLGGEGILRTFGREKEAYSNLQSRFFSGYLLISFRAFLLSDVLNRHVEVLPVDVVPYM